MQLSYSFLARSLALLLLPLGAALAQTTPGVGIGTTAPDASAALDIVSSTKGALLPRVASAAAIATPATGLLVFQTSAPAGFYYNAGTAAAPSWQRLAGAGPTGTDYVQNQTSTDQAGGFRVAGAGTVGGRLTANGGATVTGTTAINADGAAGTTIGGLGTGSVTIGGAGVVVVNGGGTAIGNNYASNTAIGTGAYSTTSLASNSYSSATLGSGFTSSVTIGSGFASNTTIAGAATATTNIGNGSNSGPVTIGRSGGVVRVASLSTTGVVTTDASGNLSSATAASLDATTAGNGLTETGQNVALGGTLTQNTALILNGNNLAISGGLSVDQNNLNATIGNAFTSYMLLTQTIQAGLTGDLVQVVLSLKGNGTRPVPTLTVYRGSGTSGAILGTATLSAPPPLGTANSTFTFGSPPALVAGQTYTLALTNLITSTGNSVNWSVSSGNPYAGGNANADPDYDFLFRTLMAFPATFTVTGAATGLNTSSPTATLDVNGPTRLRSLTTAGVVTTDADGNLSSTGSDSFILNQTSTAQPGGFRVAGPGTVGGTLTVDAAGANAGSLTNGLRLGEAGTGEGLASRRTTGLNRYGLDLYTANTARLSITQSGSVGIGLADPAVALHVAGQLRANVGLQFADRAAPANLFEWFASGGTAALYSTASARNVCAITTNGNMGINVAPSTSYTLDVGGTVRATGAVTANGFNNVSDQRLKTDIRPLRGALAGVLALRGVRYHWNALGVQRGGTAGQEQVGLLAQEVEAIYPELVATGPDGFKAVNYAQLAPVLIEALKELQAENEALRTTTATDHAALQTLQQQVARLLGEAPAGTQARR